MKVSSVNSARIRILVLAGQLGLGGTERQLYYLLRALDRERFEVQVLNLSDGGGTYWKERILGLTIRVKDVFPGNRLQRAWRIRRVAQRWRAGVVHSCNYHVNGYGALAGRLPARPVVGSLRNLPGREHLDGVPGFWKRLCLYGVDRLVCNSHASEQMLHRLYPDLTNIDVIPNGVALIDDEELERLRRGSYQELGRREGELLIGFVGYLGAQKNVSLLLQAVAQVRPSFPQLRLVVVGDGPLRPPLQLQASQAGLGTTTTFLGQRPLAEELMPAFDVLCLPSDYEGMPNVLMEAGAAGVPVVASRVGDVPHVVVDGETGFLHSAGDAESLAAHLKRLLADRGLRYTMGQAARARMRRLFSIEKMVEQYERVYLELAADRRGKLTDER